MSLAHQINAGRPSVLDDEQSVLKIKQLYLEGRTEKDIAEILEIPIDTWNYWKWKNYQSFADKLLSYKHERMLMKAETNIEQLMSSDDERVKADVSKFALETLGKKNYSKRVEQSGVDGKELPVPILNINYENKGTNSEVQQRVFSETRSDSQSQSEKLTETTETQGIQENGEGKTVGEQVSTESISKDSQEQTPIFEVWNNSQ